MLVVRGTIVNSGLNRGLVIGRVVALGPELENRDRSVSNQMPSTRSPGVSLKDRPAIVGCGVGRIPEVHTAAHVPLGVIPFGHDDIPVG